MTHLVTRELLFVKSEGGAFYGSSPSLFIGHLAIALKDPKIAIFFKDTGVCRSRFAPLY